MPKALLTATVQSHIAQFHEPAIRLLHEHGYEVHVAARDNLDVKEGLTLTSPDRIFDVGFERSPASPRNLLALRQLRTIMRDNDYDIIHCNTPVAGVLTRLAAAPHRRNVVTTVQRISDRRVARHPAVEWAAAARAADIAGIER